MTALRLDTAVSGCTGPCGIKRLTPIVDSQTIRRRPSHAVGRSERTTRPYDQTHDRRTTRPKERMSAEKSSRPQINVTQVMAGALAAVTSAVIGSRLGVAGTLVGAALGSVIATMGGALYSSWLRRTATQVRTVVRLPATRSTSSEATADDAPTTTIGLTGASAETSTFSEQLQGAAVQEPEPGRVDPAPGPDRDRRLPQPTWRTVGIAAVATFAVAIGSITAFEALVGEPVSTLTGGNDGGGTTIGRVVEGPTPVPTETAPTETPTTRPSETTSETPSESPTTEPTETTPTESPTETPTETPTGEPTSPPTSAVPTTPPVSPTSPARTTTPPR